jgi:hypothetical protein
MSYKFVDVGELGIVFAITELALIVIPVDLLSLNASKALEVCALPTSFLIDIFSFELDDKGIN